METARPVLHQLAQGAQLAKQTLTSISQLQVAPVTTELSTTCLQPLARHVTIHATTVMDRQIMTVYSAKQTQF